MANKEQFTILKQGVDEWNTWREKNKVIKADLRGVYLHGADLRGADLRGADLREADLRGASLNEADLTGAELRAADLREVYLREAHLRGADLRGAHLRGAHLPGAELRGAELTGADLRGADLRGASLNEADLTEADLTGADLERVMLVHTNFTRANLSNCRIFGISAWELILEETIQTDLIITQRNKPTVTVDNLEVAQFIYLLLHNEKIRSVIDTITSKAVLILGRFTPERKAVLDALREELRRRNYAPIVFDFEKPTHRDLTETIMTLAGMARFVIADLSDPNSIPHELMSFTEKLLSVPVQAIFCPVAEHTDEYPMFKDPFWRYPHVLPIYRYESQEQLISILYEKVIQPAEDRVKAMLATRQWIKRGL